MKFRIIREVTHTDATRSVNVLYYVQIKKWWGWSKVSDADELMVWRGRGGLWYRKFKSALAAEAAIDNYIDYKNACASAKAEFGNTAVVKEIMYIKECTKH